MMDSQRITIKDIAEELNVSVGTVDRAINGRGRIKEETKRSIMEKIEELGYKPNKIASALAKTNKIRIAFITPAHNSFWFEIIDGAHAACDELSDFGLQLEFYNQESDVDSVRQIKEIESLIPQAPDGMIIAPLHQYLSLAPINQAAEKGIPVVTVNMDVPDSKRICYVGENAFYAGSLIGNLFGRFLGGRGDIAILLGSSELAQFRERKNGFLHTLQEKYPEINIIGNYQFGNSEDVAYEIAKKLMADNPSLRGIFTNMSTGAMAIGKAIRDAGNIHKIVSVGYDTNELIFELLEQNAISATVTQSPFQQGYHAVKLMHKIIMEKQAPEHEFNYVHADILLDRGQCDVI